MFFVECEYLGEVMITQVSSLSSGSVARDPRRKAQSIKFKHRSNMPYKSGYNEQYEHQKNNALLTSITIIAGSMLFTLGYFLLSALRTKAPKAAI